MKTKEKLLEKVKIKFPWVSYDAEIVRCYPNINER